MALLLGRRVCQAACILSIFMVIGATGTIVAGFINMGTFHATAIKSTVGIWCGLCMFLQVFLGLMLMGTRQPFVGALYFLVSFGCVGVAALSIYFSVQYYDEFRLFSDYNNQVAKNSKPSFCVVREDQCKCFWNNIEQKFKDGFQFLNCPLISFGEDLWISMLVLQGYNALIALLGTVIGFRAIVAGITKKGKRVRN